MRKHYYTSEFKANVELSDEEFDLLFKSASNHYDSKVKSLTVPGYGATLYGLKNRRDWEKEEAKEDGIEIDLDYINMTEFKLSTLNLFLKSLEMNKSHEAFKLYNRLSNIFKDMQQKNIEYNNILEQIKIES